ncbi:hypothetical protein D3C73_1455880 [compost metagenome]
MARAGVQGVEKLLGDTQEDFFHNVSVAATNAMKADIEKAMKIFYNISTDIS